MSTTTTPSLLSGRLVTGTKVCIITSVLLIVLAAYFYFVPINITAQQGVFGCGSASNPPTEDFAKGVCQDLATINRIKAVSALISAFLVTGLGFLLFGSHQGSFPRVAADGQDPAELDS
ncbi:hypothetical protein [Nostocoides veronense]|uniref:Uncharacterized protein n=1 Tax=Nostocoides veronense TaxID=330836 RepID=A0ABP4XPI0_9MICO